MPDGVLPISMTKRESNSGAFSCATQKTEFLKSKSRAFFLLLGQLPHVGNLGC